MTREDFLVLVEDLLAYEPDESIDPPLQETGACVVPQGSCYSCQQYRGVYNTSARLRDLFLADNLDLWLEATRATI